MTAGTHDLDRAPGGGPARPSESVLPLSREEIARTKAAESRWRFNKD